MLFFFSPSKGTYGFPASYFSVRVGSQFINRGGEIITVGSLINHPDFNPYSFDYDFALLRLTKNIRIDGVTKAIIKLPPANQPINDGEAVRI